MHRKPYLLGHADGSLMRICQQQHQVIFVDNKVKIKKLESNLSHVAKRKKSILKLDSFVVVVAVIDVVVVVDIVIVAVAVVFAIVVLAVVVSAVLVIFVLVVKIAVVTVVSLHAFVAVVVSVVTVVVAPFSSLKKILSSVDF